MVRAVDVDLVELFHDLIRFETELWDRVGARVQQAHGSPLAWLEIMQVVDVTADCRVLDIARALSIALSAYVGAAAPAGELAQLSVTLRRLRQHLMSPDPADLAAGR
jgi:hypothetical protein